MQYSTITKLLLTLALGLITTFVIDPLDKSTISSPFCLGILLMCLSLRQSVFVVWSASALYTILSSVALIRGLNYYIVTLGVPVPHPYFWFFQRIGLFLILCTLSIYVAHYRSQSKAILNRLRGVLSKLPNPVLLSDASGRIVYANDAASLALKKKTAEIIGANFFDLLPTHPTKGAAIRTYFELFDSESMQGQEQRLAVSTLENTVSAQVITLGTGANRVLLTLLQGSVSQLAAV